MIKRILPALPPRRTSPQQPAERSPIILIFILSGVAGLIYEVVWSRQLVLVFGNTTQAVSAILTGFFGGMAIGNVLGGRLADRVRRPLRLYGLLELILAAVVVATPGLFALITELYRGSYQSLEGSPQVLALVRFAAALVMLGPATILMGATLPTLTRHLSRHGDELSTSFGRLYAANTMGATLGAALAGIVLIELEGLMGTLIVGASCSASAGALALALDLAAARRARTIAASERRADRPGAAAAQSMPVTQSRLRLALGFAFVSGATSLAYQTCWTRLLASGTGNSTYVFTLILFVFLCGLTLGAAAYDSLKTRSRNPVAALGMGQLLIAAFALIGLAILSAPTYFPRATDVALLRTLVLPIFAVVLPATLVMGFSLPVASQLVGSSDKTVGKQTGLLLGVNTCGSIIGTFVVPFFVIPAIGSAPTVALTALLNVAAAFALTSAAARGPSVNAGRYLVGAGRAASAAFGVLLVVVLIVPGGITNPDVARITGAGGHVYASAEDEVASVQAGVTDEGTAGLWVTGNNMTAPTVDTRLMAVLPLALRPRSTNALVVCLGMGFTYRSSLRAGLVTDAVELVPSVPQMLPKFLDDASAVAANPNGHVFVGDGRAYVELTDRRYDIVVVDPPPPSYSSGVSVISSLEWYRAVRNRLTPGGVMMEWVPMGQTIDEFRMDVRSFATAFPHVLLILSPGQSGTYMLGSDAPLVFDNAAFAQILARPGVLEDLSSAGDSPKAATPESWGRLIERLIFLPDGTAAAWAGGGPVMTDDHPYAEYFILRQLSGRRIIATTTDVLLAARP